MQIIFPGKRGCILAIIGPLLAALKPGKCCFPTLIAIILTVEQ